MNAATRDTDDITTLRHQVVEAERQAKTSTREVTQLRKELRGALQANRKATDIYHAQLERSWEDGLLATKPKTDKQGLSQ